MKEYLVSIIVEEGINFIEDVKAKNRLAFIFEIDESLYSMAIEEFQDIEVFEENKPLEDLLYFKTSYSIILEENVANYLIVSFDWYRNNIE